MRKRCNFRPIRGSGFLFLLGLCFVLLTSGCGSDSYDQPLTANNNSAVSGAATNVLIEPATLMAWMDQGLVNSESSFNAKVIVLDYGSYSGNNDVDPPRISGACRVNNTELASRRVEGVAEAFPLVASGAQMDAALQRLGIDGDTTIVFTTAGSMYFPTRAYWMFRYWGFPKEKLKLLNGGNAAFAAQFPGLMTKVSPTPNASDFSVKDLAAELQSDLRMSIGEMISLLKTFDSASDVILDARGPNNYAGLASSPGYVTGKVDFTVYDGHPAGGQYLAWKDLFDADNKFLSAADIKALFAAKGWSTNKMTTVYCLSGYSATPLFFAVDAILGGPVRLYDGSWSQWGQYSSNGAALGELPAGSAWSTDQFLAVDEGYRYNIDYLNGKTVSGIYPIETLQLDDAAIAAQPSPFSGNDNTSASDVVQSQVEAADAAYVGNATPLVFPAQVATATPDVLIDETVLQGWDTAGLINAPFGAERVVLLDVTDVSTYIKGHIDGAQLWDITKHSEIRVEGPAPAVNLVPSGATMDQLIQEHGIDENTTIVITSSKAATYYASRAYFLFRYYGFPKERIKVLNGYNGGWSGSISLVSPSVTPSTLSVQDIANIQLNTRASLAEMMDAVRDGRGTAIDVRGNKSGAGSTSGVYSDVANDYVVFEGTPAGGTSYVWKNFSLNYAAGDFTFKDATTIANEMLAAGIDTSSFSSDGSYSDPVYSYCKTGYVASVGFFVLDGILGVDVMAYDGSWSQWGKMSADASKGGELPVGSAWATDTVDYMSVINYNADATRLKTIESLNPDSTLLDYLPGDPETDQVEEADTEYKIPQTDTPSTPLPPAYVDSGVGC